MQSLATDGHGRRLHIEVDLPTWRILRHEWISEYRRYQAIEVTHVVVDSVIDVGNGEQIQQHPLPVNPRQYPPQNIAVRMFEKSADEKWAIGQVNGDVWAFFLKTQVYGYYWVATKLQNLPTESERIKSKLAKGYQGKVFANCGHVFDHRKLIVTIQ